MGVVERLRVRAATSQKTGPKALVALPEAEDPRILAAAVEANRAGVCTPVLVGDKATIRRTASESRIELGDLDPTVIDPSVDSTVEKYCQVLSERLAPFTAITASEVRALVHQPIYYANLLVADGRVDGAVLGAIATTTETLRTALRVIGADDQGLVTSCFLMVLPDGTALVFADCGVIPEPTSEQLATIATHAANTYRLLVEDQPRVALLSFSSHGSARHPAVDKVAEATTILRSRDPDFSCDGELQVDAAIVPEIARRKASSSELAGRANVLVFPDLNSGNIAYKLTERLGHARAVGPLLRGLAAPIHDLSRGCGVEDILDTLAITVLDARATDGRTAGK